MKALVLEESEANRDATKGFELKDIPAPHLDEREDPHDAVCAILKMKYAGCCGTDKSIYYRTAFKDVILRAMKQDQRTNLTLGHELYGEVVAAGSALKERYGIEVGDTVSAESHVFCGRCYQCRIGEANVCTNERIIGVSMHGGFAEYVKLPGKVLWPTDPEIIRPELAAIQEPLGNSVFACNHIDIRGKTICIFGLGTIGLFTVLVARALGATRIIGIEPQARNCQLAKELGIDEVIQIDLTCTPKGDWHENREVVDAIKAFTHDIGVDVSIEMSGQNSNVNTAVQATRRGGDIILFGINRGDFVLANFEQIIAAGISFRSVIGRHIFKTWYNVRNLLESKSNGVADKIYNVILNGGKGTILPFHEFKPEVWETATHAFPKILFRF